MEAAKLEGVRSGLAGSDCGLRQSTSILMPANATWGNCGRLLSAASSLTGLRLALAKESSHGAVCWSGRIPEGDESLRGGSNGHDPVARQVCVDT